MNENKEHLSSQPSPGLRWVKACERLPEPETWVFLIISYPGVDSRMDSGRLHGDRFQTRTHDYNVERQGAFIEWLEEIPNCYPEGGGEGEEDRFCPKCGESWEAHSTICRRKPETRAIDVDADEAKGEIEFLDRDNDRLRAALRDIAGGTALPQLIAQQALGPAPEAQPIAPYPKGYIPTGTELPGTHYAEGCGAELVINEPPIPDDEEEDDIYDAVRKYRDAHPEKSTPKQPIADGKEVPPEEIKEWMDDSSECDSDDDATLWRNGAIAMYHKMRGRIKEIYEVHKSISDSYNELLPREIKLTADLLAARNKNNDDGIEIARLQAEKKEYAVNEQKIGRNLLDAYRVISGLLPANSQWQEKYIHKCNDLTAMIDEALQKSKELDALAPEIKRQTIDRLYNEILAAGVEFPPAAREVFHRAMNELTASPTQNPDK